MYSCTVFKICGVINYSLCHYVILTRSSKTIRFIKIRYYLILTTQWGGGREGVYVSGGVWLGIKMTGYLVLETLIEKFNPSLGNLRIICFEICNYRKGSVNILWCLLSFGAGRDVTFSWSINGSR